LEGFTDFFLDGHFGTIIPSQQGTTWRIACGALWQRQVQRSGGDFSAEFLLRELIENTTVAKIFKKNENCS